MVVIPWQQLSAPRTPLILCKRLKLGIHSFNYHQGNKISIMCVSCFVIYSFKLQYIQGLLILLLVIFFFFRCANREPQLEDFDFATIESVVSSRFQLTCCKTSFIKNT